MLKFYDEKKKQKPLSLDPFDQIAINLVEWNSFDSPGIKLFFAKGFTAFVER